MPFLRSAALFLCLCCSAVPARADMLPPESLTGWMKAGDPEKAFLRLVSVDLSVAEKRLLCAAIAREQEIYYGRLIKAARNMLRNEREIYRRHAVFTADPHRKLNRTILDRLTRETLTDLRSVEHTGWRRIKHDGKAAKRVAAWSADCGVNARRRAEFARAALERAFSRRDMARAENLAAFLEENGYDIINIGRDAAHIRFPY